MPAASGTTSTATVGTYALLLSPPASIYSAPFLPAPGLVAGESTLYLGGAPPATAVLPPNSNPNTDSSSSSSSGSTDEDATAPGAGLLSGVPLATDLPYASVYAPSVCGRRLPFAYTSSTSGVAKEPVATESMTTGLLDTASSCLTLPAATFDALVSWLPLQCITRPVDALDMLSSTARICRYLYASAAQATAKATPLPSLDFALTPATAVSTYLTDDHDNDLDEDWGSAAGYLHLPLERLLLPFSAISDDPAAATAAALA